MLVLGRRGDGRWEADVGGIVCITPRQPLLAQGEKPAETVQSSALVFASHGPSPFRPKCYDHTLLLDGPSWNTCMQLAVIVAT